MSFETQVRRRWKRRKTVELRILTVSTGCSLRAYKVKSFETLYELKKILMPYKCETSALRLYWARRKPEPNLVAGGNIQYDDWIGTEDAEVEHFKRIDFFPEVVEKLTPPEFEMQDDKRMSDYFNKQTLWREDLLQLHVIVKIVRPEFVRMFCPKTNRMETREFAVEMQLQMRMRENRLRNESSTRHDSG